MAYTTEWARINEIKIKIATGTRGTRNDGDTQTINVCDEHNIDGDYREVYRISAPNPFLCGPDIENNNSLIALDQFLVTQGARREGPRKRRTRT